MQAGLFPLYSPRGVCRSGKDMSQDTCVGGNCPHGIPYGDGCDECAAKQEGVKPMFKLPCDDPCPKCGSIDIYRNYRRAGDNFDDADTPPSKFINRISEFTRQASRECITHHCRVCSFDWQTKPLKRRKS